jgi:uncharacterized glyoxalase superfamily protein PhnB
MTIGHPTVLTRVFVDDPARAVAFLRDVFAATVDDRGGPGPTEVRLGGSVVLVSGTEARGAFPAFLYVYVDDADATYATAVEHGAETLEAPLDTPYGDRRAMVRDPDGNIFQIAHHNAGTSAGTSAGS